MTTNGQLTDLDRIIASDMDQRTDSWHDVRLGRFTASEISKLVSKKGQFTQTAMTYIFEKAAEVITGERKVEVSSRATEWGVEFEPVARKEFEEANGLTVQLTGFHPYGDHAGGSPDGLVLNSHIIEIKCPYVTANHLKYCMMKQSMDLLDIAPEYFYQMQANMLFTGRDHGYFISFDPRIKGAGRLFVLSVPADPVFQAEIKSLIEKAAVEKMKIINSVTNPNN